MAWMPGVDTSKRAADGNSRLTCKPDIVCLHTIVGYAPALAAHFSVAGNGHKWQHRDSLRQSAANLNGNDHIIAIETEDHGSLFGSWSGSNVPAWTPQQIESLAQICAWAYKTHGIPLAACPDSKPGSRGIAYHRQGIDGNFGSFKYGGRVAGGEVWSSAYGKVCPGDKRIAQIPQIIKRARQLAGLEADTGGDDDLKDDERRWLKELHDLYRKGNPQPFGKTVYQSAGELTIYIVEMLRRSRRLEAAINGLVAVVAKGSDLTVEDVKAAVEEALKDAVVDVDINVNKITDVE